MTDAALERLSNPRPLSPSETHATFNALLSPDATESDRVALLRGLTARRATARELTQFVLEMRHRAVPFPVPPGDRPIDLCGSGGAPTPSFNVSTVSSFVVAAAGVPVVKHGNRSSRGPCGSSDLLEALGLPVTRSRALARATYRRFRLAFLHAPLFHPATRAVASARRSVGIPTVFNQLGPLSNPARVEFQVVGVASLSNAELAVQVLRRLGRRRAMAMTSDEGCDEFSPRRETRAVFWDGQRRSRRAWAARALLPPEDRRGDWGPLPPPEAAEEARRILAGGDGARRGSVLITAGAALWVAGAARSVPNGIERAKEALDSGRAEAILEGALSIGSRYGPGPGG